MTRHRCFCQQMGFTFTVCRIFGLFPVTWHHNKTGICTYQISKLWRIYSIIISFVPFRTIHLITKHNFSKLLLPYILSLVNEALSALSTTILILTCVIRAQKIVIALNSIPTLNKKGLFCQMAMNGTRLFQYGVDAALLVMFLTQISFLIIFGPGAKTNYEDIFIRMFSTIPVCFYILFMQICLTSSMMFSCFNQIAMKTSLYHKVHPCNNVEEIPSKYMFFAYVDRKPCKNKQHLAIRGSLGWSNMEKLDAMRDIHNTLCETFEMFSVSLNPHLLIFMTLELLAIVLNGYALVILARYAVHMKNLLSFVLVNWSFIVWRLFGMLMLINAASTFNTEVSLN